LSATKHALITTIFESWQFNDKLSELTSDTEPRVFYSLNKSKKEESNKMHFYFQSSNKLFDLFYSYRKQGYLD